MPQVVIWFKGWLNSMNLFDWQSFSASPRQTNGSSFYVERHPLNMGCYGANGRKEPMKKWIVVIIILAVIALAGIGSYNRLVGLSQGVEKQWAQVQNVYQRRLDLIPNLVATVSGAANFEKSTLTEITQARASVGTVKVDPSHAPDNPAKLAEFDRAPSQLSSALSRLLVVVERYPELKATENFK